MQSHLPQKTSERPPRKTEFLRHKKAKDKVIPVQAQSVPGGLVSQISRQLAHEGGKVVSSRHRPPLPRGNFPGTCLC